MVFFFRLELHLVCVSQVLGLLTGFFEVCIVARVLPQTGLIMCHWHGMNLPLALTVVWHLPASSLLVCCAASLTC